MFTHKPTQIIITTEGKYKSSGCKSSQINKLVMSLNLSWNNDCIYYSDYSHLYSIILGPNSSTSKISSKSLKLTWLVTLLRLSQIIPPIYLMGAQRPEIIPAPIGVAGVVPAVGLKLEERLGGIILMRRLSKSILRWMQLGRWLGYEHRLCVRHFFLWKKFGFGSYSTEKEKFPLDKQS